MASTGTRKKKSGGSPNTGKASSKSRKKPSDQKNEASGLSLEIGILIALALSILLLISNFDLGGSVGNAVSKFFFGLMGWIAYLFPVALFLGTIFLAANRKNRLIWRKMVSLVLGFWFLSGLIHLFTMGYVKGEKVSSYFRYCSAQKTGGGVIGGSLAKVLCMAFGTIGAYVVLIAAFLIALMILTQRSLLRPIKKNGEKAYRKAQASRQRRKEERKALAMEQQKRSDETDRRARNFEREANGEAEGLTEPGSRKKKKEFLPLIGRQELEEKKEPTGRKERTEKRESAEGDGQTGTERNTPPDPFTIQRPAPVEELFEENPSALPSVQQEAEDSPSGAEEPNQPGSRKRTRASRKEINDGIQNIQDEISENQEQEPKQYEFPPVSLLNRGPRTAAGDSDQQVRQTAMKLQDTLHSFGVSATVTNVSCGPAVTRYELQPEQGVKVSRIVSLSDDIQLNLAAADIRIEAPIAGKSVVGIEVPNKKTSAVHLRDLLETREFREFPSELAFAVGKDIAGMPVIADIGKMPHLLIAGATGSGKSVCINTLIMSLIYKASPDNVKLIMIDPKVVELSVYNGIPHLFIPVVTDPKKAAGALNWAVSEMTDRYKKFAEYGVRDLEGYNEKIAHLETAEGEEKPKKLPKIVIIVDELADLMMVASSDVEDAICRLAQLARAAGLHLIIATQRPSVNVITGLIKANMPSRIAFAVSSGVDSRTILDMTGAEKLLGKGDMLYYPYGYSKPARLQGAFVSDTEVGQVVDFLTDGHRTDSVYDPKITDVVNTGSASSAGGAGDELDTYFAEAGRFIIEKDKASIGMLQRAFKIGFNRAARVMDQLAQAGVVGPEEGTKPRKILMSMEEFENYMEESL